MEQVPPTKLGVFCGTEVNEKMARPRTFSPGDCKGDVCWTMAYKRDMYSTKLMGLALDNGHRSWALPLVGPTAYLAICFPDDRSVGKREQRLGLNWERPPFAQHHLSPTLRLHDSGKIYRRCSRIKSDPTGCRGTFVSSFPAPRCSLGVCDIFLLWDRILSAYRVKVSFSFLVHGCRAPVCH